MKKYRLILIVSVLSTLLLLFSACSSDEPLHIEKLDSLEVLHTETETTTETVSATETPHTEEPTVNETTEKTVTTQADTTVNPQQNNTEESATVYITPSGKRYHLSSTCGGKNSYSVSINDIGSRTPCKKCAQ